MKPKGKKVKAPYATPWKVSYPDEPKSATEPIVMREVPPPYYSAADLAPEAPPAESMVRTQIYLTRSEHEFLTLEADRNGEPMSAFLRRIIDERMQLPEAAWNRNPMLEETPDVEGWTGHEDGALNHDHYVYGGAKKYERTAQGLELQPPIKE